MDDESGVKGPKIGPERDSQRHSSRVTVLGATLALPASAYEVE
jgi:hypothetical protein